MDVEDQSYQSSAWEPQSNLLGGGLADDIEFNFGNDSRLHSARGASQGLSVPLLQPQSTEVHKVITTFPLSQGDFDFDFLETPKQSHHQDAYKSSGDLESSDPWAVSTKKALNGLIILLSHSSTVISASKAFHHLLGLEMEDILGVNIRDIMHPDDKTRFESSLSVLVSTEYPVSCRYRLEDIGGRYIHFVSICQVLTGHAVSNTHDAEDSDRYTILIISEMSQTGRSLTRQLQTQNRILHGLQQRLIELEACQAVAGCHIRKPFGESSRMSGHSTVVDGVRSEKWFTDWSQPNLHPDLRPFEITSIKDSEEGSMRREIASSRNFNRANRTESNRAVERKRMPNFECSRVDEAYMCYACGTSDTPEWRKGPKGPKTLCNACGLKWSKRVNRDNKSIVSV